MVTITPVAEQKIQELMKEEKDIVGLRIYVRGGGCHEALRSQNTPSCGGGQ